MPNSLDLTRGPWTRENLEEMWESMRAVLPQDAFRDFRSYVPFTDGEGETVAYVLPADPGGASGRSAWTRRTWGTGTIFWRPCSTSTATTSP